jgi:glycosyltransferase involved in cell wall biosynthesis
MKSLHVCVVSQQFKEVLSGPGLYTRNLVEGLLEQDYAVTLLTPEDSTRIRSDGLEIVEVGNRKMPKSQGGWLRLALAFSRKLKQLLKDKKFDLCHFTDAKEALFSVRLGIPMIGNVNDPYIALSSLDLNIYRRDYPEDGVRRWIYYNLMHGLEQYTLKRLDVNICNSKFTKRVILDRYRLPVENVALCYKSIAIETYQDVQSDTLSSKPPSVLFMGGGNAQRKGLIAFLGAAAVVHQDRPEIDFIIVGRDQVISRLLKKMSGESVSGRLTHIEHVPNEDMKYIYAGVDIFVMPSLIEAFGVVYLEAMACGIPVIGTTNGGANELISHEHNGLLVEPGDAVGLAREILRLLTNKKLRNTLVENAKSTVLGYSTKKMLENTVAIYNSRLGIETSCSKN